MFSANLPSSPVYLFRGFGEDQEASVGDWINTILQPIADTVKKYYELQAQQYGTQAQKVVQSTSFPNLSSINPLYLAGGGFLLWYLFKGGGIKGKTRKSRKNPYRRRR